MKMFIRLFTCLFFLGGSALAQDISPILKFGLFADTQYADCTSENARFYSYKQNEESVYINLNAYRFFYLFSMRIQSGNSCIYNLII